MAKFHICKEPLQPQFLGLNIQTAGQAAGKLKLCGLKLYLYLMSNADGFTWTMNPQAYANWLGIEDYSKSGRTVRKAIEDGITDLRANGFIEVNADGSYNILEQFVPVKMTESESNKSGTICSSVESRKEQKVPNQEQTVPLKSMKGTESTRSGTNSSPSRELFGF